MRRKSFSTSELRESGVSGHRAGSPPARPVRRDRPARKQSASPVARPRCRAGASRSRWDHCSAVQQPKPGARPYGCTCPCSSAVGRSALVSPCSARNPRCAASSPSPMPARRRVREQHVDAAPGASRRPPPRRGAQPQRRAAACCRCGVLVRPVAIAQAPAEPADPQPGHVDDPAVGVDRPVRPRRPGGQPGPQRQPAPGSSGSRTGRGRGCPARRPAAHRGR